jgi:nucleoid-associated protein YgaU
MFERRLIRMVKRSLVGCTVGLAALCAPGTEGCGPSEPATTQPVVQTADARPGPTERSNVPRPGDNFDVTKVPGRIHSVRPNDTLWNLAERYYGNGKHWRKILVANRNRLTNSTDLPVGMKLIIP